MKKKKKKEKNVQGEKTLKGGLVPLSHFCGFVDVADTKEKDMRMVKGEKRRRPGVTNTAVCFCFCS